MDKMELIKDNLAKIDKAIEVAVHAGDGQRQINLITQRRWFVIDACSMIDRDAAQAGERSQCGDKAVMKETNYQRILSLAIEKARKKAEVSHDQLPAAIDVYGCGRAIYRPCPHGIDAKVGFSYCTCFCPHFVRANQQRTTVCCWYPEKGR